MRLAVVAIAILLPACSPDGEPASLVTVPLVEPQPFGDALGTSEDTCVDVDAITSGAEGRQVVDVRSGDIVAGNWGAVVGSWGSFDDGEAKLYWIPLDPELARTEQVAVTVESLDGGTVSTQTFSGGYTESDEGAYYFWSSGTMFPDSGRYRIVAEAPGHRGCFEVTV